MPLESTTTYSNTTQIMSHNYPWPAEIQNATRIKYNTKTNNQAAHNVKHALLEDTLEAGGPTHC